MPRSVSQEGDLLLRGVNLRSGIPSSNRRTNSSFDNTELARTKDLAPPGKVRLQGDQWTRFDMGQTTLPQTPPSARLLAISPRTPRTPGGLTSAEVNQSPSDGTGSAPDVGTCTRQVQGAESLDPEQTIVCVKPTSDLPRKHPATPRKEQRSGDLILEPTTDPVIRRKPVRSPPNKQVAERKARGVIVEASNDTAIRKRLFQEEMRSSSAPTPHKSRNFTFVDVGKDLPALPPETPCLDVEGDRGRSLERLILGTTQRDTVVSPRCADSTIRGPTAKDKELPRPPANSGQGEMTQLPPPNQVTCQGDDAVEAPSQHRIPRSQPAGPRGGDETYPYIRTPRSLYLMPQSQKRKTPLGARVMPIPAYDNPPSFQPQPLIRRTAPRVEGPRSMPPSTANDVGALTEPFKTPRRITSPNTNVLIPESLPPRPLRVGQHPSAVGGPRGLASKPAAMPASRSQPYQSTTNEKARTNMNTDNMMSIPMPRTRPRGMSRPSVPARAVNDMYSVASVLPLQKSSNTADTAYQQMWRLTGAQDKNGETTTLDHDSDLVPQPLKPRIPQALKIEHKGNATPDDAAESGLGLLRKCSRCHNGFVNVDLANAHGVIPARGSQKKSEAETGGGKRIERAHLILERIQEETKAANEKCQTRQTRASSEGLCSVENLSQKQKKVDEMDHSICCPDCCSAYDCHEGCMGHPSPVSAGTKAIRPSGEIDASVRETDGVDGKKNMASERSRNGKLAFMKPALRKSPQSSFNSGNDDDEKSPSRFGGGRLAELDTSFIELSAHPPSPAMSCWGAGAGAAGAPDTTAPAAVAAWGMRTMKPVNATIDAGTPMHDDSVPNAWSPEKGMRSVSLPLLINKGPSRAGTWNQTRRAASGSRLPSLPESLTIGPRKAKSRDVSGASAATIEWQVPAFGSVGCGAVWEMAFVAFEASKMWIQNHPEVMVGVWHALEKAWEMGQIMAMTGSRLWAVVFVYSKTGKLRLNTKKGETAGGFVIDCARSLLYLIIFLSVSALAIRILRVVLGAVGVAGWFLMVVVWLLKKAVGLGVWG